MKAVAAGSVVDLIAAARATVGTRENPPGSNRQPFAREVGHANGYAWCQSWANAMAKRAGVELPPGVMETAYTPTAVNAFKKAGRWSPTPEVGDFAYFQFDNDPQVDHVAIVVEVLASGDVRTIEGNTSPTNTSPTNTGSQSHGGQVCERTRPRRVIVGFGRPLFAASTAPAPTRPTSGDRIDMIAKDADDAARCQIREWCLTHWGVQPTPDEQTYLAAIARTKGADACLAVISDDQRARARRGAA